MKIMLNLLPLKVGGGVQVGLDFIENAKKLELGQKHEWLVVATKGTAFSNIRPGPNLRIARLVPDNILARIWFEYFGCRRLVREFNPDIIYTQFGVHWPGAPRDIPHIVGCAFPYLAYPDGMKLWDGESPLKRLRLYASVWHNSRNLRRADEVIFETEVMARRTTRNLGLDPDKAHVVRPACSSLVRPGQRHAETADRCRALPRGFRILLIAGYSPHKNIFLLPRIAEVLKNTHGLNDTVFVTTLAPEHPKTSAFFADAAARGTQSMIYNFGPVSQDGCAELYSAVDAVILPSRLESFSNTVAEAWTMGKPLLVSDLDWAREACGDGAHYFRYDDATEAAAAIVLLRKDAASRARFIDAGKKMMATYPSSEERFLQYLRVIESRYARISGGIRG